MTTTLPAVAAPATQMSLLVVTPGTVVVDDTAKKVTTHAVNGSFTLLPRHIDFVATLVPGLLSYLGSDGVERLVAIDGGVLVKQGASVRVASDEAVAGDDVLALQRALRASYAEYRETERRARTAIAHLETDALRRLMELGDHD
jgi:F-type H+-transporting ATPase subunit epsilon